MSIPISLSREEHAYYAGEVEKTLLTVADALEQGEVPPSCIAVGMVLAASRILGARWEGREEELVAAWRGLMQIGEEQAVYVMCEVGIVAPGGEPN